MWNGNATIILLTVGSITKIHLNKMSYFPEPHTQSKYKIETELYFSNYGTKSDFKRPCWYIVFCQKKKPDLASLKSEVDQLDKILWSLWLLPDQTNREDWKRSKRKTLECPFRLKRKAWKWYSKRRLRV